MPLPYATTANVKTRLGITSTDKDALISRLCEEMNTYVESVTRRAIGSSSVSSEVIDGWRRQEDGYVLPYPRGIRSISTLEMRLTTTSDYSTVPATDYFIRPEEPYRTPGWPGFEIVMTDIPSSGNATPTIEVAIGAVRHTSAIGWAQMPADIRGVAEVGVSRAFHARQAAYADDVGTDELGEITVSRYLSTHDWRILKRYRWEVVEVI